MREDEDIRQYMPVLRRFIILVAVIIAIPVVMWTITAMVRTYVGPPKLPTFRPMAAAPAGPDQAAAAPIADETGKGARQPLVETNGTTSDGGRREPVRPRRAAGRHQLAKPAGHELAEPGRRTAGRRATGRERAANRRPGASAAQAAAKLHDRAEPGHSAATATPRRSRPDGRTTTGDARDLAAQYLWFAAAGCRAAACRRRVSARAALSGLFHPSASAAPIAVRRRSRFAPADSRRPPTREKSVRHARRRASPW